MRHVPHILIVEDEVMIAMCLELEFKQLGYHGCQRAITGEDAVRIAQQESPDCILMDIRLAGDLDGIEAAQQIQAQTAIPIIFMTGYPDKAIEERAKALNPLGFFIKPVRALRIDDEITCPFAFRAIFLSYVRIFVVPSRFILTKRSVFCTIF